MFGYAVLFGVRLELQKLAREYESQLTNRTFTNNTSDRWTSRVNEISCEYGHLEYLFVSQFVTSFNGFLASNWNHLCFVLMTQVCFDNKCPHYYQYDFSNIILKHGLTRFQGRKNTGYMGTYNYPRSPESNLGNSFLKEEWQMKELPEEQMPNPC